MDSHNPTRLDILGDESGVKERRATKERDETTSARRRTGRVKDKPLKREGAGAEIYVI